MKYKTKYIRVIQKIGKAGLIIYTIGCLFGFTIKQESLFVEEKDNKYCFHNTKAELVVEKNSWHLKLIGEDGNVQYEEAKAPSFLIDNEWVSLSKVERIEETEDDKIRLHIVLGNDKKAIAEVEKAGDYGFKIIIRSQGQNVSAIKGATRLKMVEEVYGFGEMWNGHVAQRGQSFDLWDHNGTPDECAYMPYYVSTNNYTFFLNYGGQVFFDVGQKRADEIVYSAPTDRFEILLVSGKSIPNAVRNFLEINGMPAAPPRWSFKPWFWLMSDPDQPEASVETLKGVHFLEMVQRLKKLDIPVGVTWFEPPWQTARTSFIPNPAFSSDLKGLIKQLSDMGVNTLTWTVPYTAPTAPNWDEAVKNGYLAVKKGSGADYSDLKISKSGEVEGTYYNYIDFFNPDAFNWWKRQIHQAIDLGFKGFKPDAGQTLQDDAALFGGRLGKDVHNSYAKEYNRVFYEALSERYGDDFLMIPRAAWVGSSSLTNFKWPGDLSGSFANNGLPSSVYSSLSLAFCGIPLVSTDIGGFVDRPSPELVWIRWAQFGAMLPGMQTLHMPWWYSDEAASHFRFLAWLHTELTPLWSTLAKEAHETGAPVCRPLVWNFQEDIDCWRVDDEFMVGNQILVAPIINPENSRKVYPRRQVD
jgi:alpha-D-xyloside xylohydrolase